ncbi:cation:proton antiporter [Sphingomonas nostoxanthinifaciens]|uniref:cation:proton antiporter n=1 Tax=Sphingomonas nostoxanthinifaciens TaxID=2872652 RepID=UPI001CC20219|nr:cation:proton antiporter [Sphingomonas nostoxanthinifaciens]UAK24092.1 cation:proton antiporter [Sphingomonas nostoxanthinifaciens]
MSFFESLLALLLAAIVLLQASRRLSLPYPAMLAAAGVGLALIPGAPSIGIDPKTALALFIAPALVDAAFDFPIGAVRKLWRPLVALAVVAVVLTAACVAWIGVAVAGLPLYAAIALGGTVAPPDAAAANAVLRTVRLPRGTMAVLRGESLLNDAMALLLFGAAVAVQEHGGIDGHIALRLGFEAPGGVLLGVGIAWLSRRLMRFTTGTLGGNLLEFVVAFGAWIVADRLGLSAVLCVVAFAMTIARGAGLSQPPRMRVHSFAVWTSVVFLLDVLAFLLMGMQARTIIGGMSPDRLIEAARFAGLVIAAVISVRLGWVIVYNRLAHRFALLRGDYAPVSLRHGLLVGWCGMRGLVTLATAFALPAAFPQRDLIVLAAFGVVLATLVVQGLTLGPLIRLVKLDGDDGLGREVDAARVDLAGAALTALEGEHSVEADHLRHVYTIAQCAVSDPPRPRAMDNRRRIALGVVRRQRERLEELRNEDRVGADAFLMLQEELDWKELSLSSEDDRQIDET